MVVSKGLLSGTSSGGGGGGGGGGSTGTSSAAGAKGAAAATVSTPISTSPSSAMKRIGKTPFISNNLNPSWEDGGGLGQEFSVGLEGLRVEVWDHDLLGSDDFLGQVILQHDDLLPPAVPVVPGRPLRSLPSAASANTSASASAAAAAAWGMKRGGEGWAGDGVSHQLAKRCGPKTGWVMVWHGHGMWV